MRHAAAGATVVRLKGGDPAVFGRLDEEVEALEAAGIGYAIVPGITAASAAAAAIGQSLTKRGRNSALRFLTGHDVDGFAEHDWRELAKPGATAAIYMGVKAATFVRGRLLMHGAAADTPVTAVENASRPGQRVFGDDADRAADGARRGAALGAGHDPLRAGAAGCGDGARRYPGGALMARQVPAADGDRQRPARGRRRLLQSIGDWSREIGDAALAVNPEAAEDLLKRASAFPNQVVGVYLVEAAVDDFGRAAPAHFREEFRTRGPSNYPEHGRQAERSDV